MFATKSRTVSILLATLLTALFTPTSPSGANDEVSTLGDASAYLDESFGINGSINIKDIFGETPIDASDTPVCAVKVNQIARDAGNGIVVLGSFHEPSNPNISIPDATGTAIGTGYINSLSIRERADDEQWDSSAVAAAAALEYGPVNGLSDWYLPSSAELNALYLDKEMRENQNHQLTAPSYWSSTESSERTAFSKSFINGLESSACKSSSLAVRPIRAGYETSTPLLVGDPGPGGGEIFYVSSEEFLCGPTLNDDCNYLEAAPSDWSSNWSYFAIDPYVSWSQDSFLDKHILFRLNSNGSYDHNFGNSQTTLRRSLSDTTPKRYVLVTTTSLLYAERERLDLEIDSQGRILVMLSGFNEGQYHNLLARYTDTGSTDLSFGDGDGVIGSFIAINGIPDSLFVDFSLDPIDKILLASLSNQYYSSSIDFYDVVVQRFTSDGTLDIGLVLPEINSNESKTVSLFNDRVPIETSTVSIHSSLDSIEIRYFEDFNLSFYRDVKIVADDANGFFVAFSGVLFGTRGDFTFQDETPYTLLLRFNATTGGLDGEFVGQIFSDDTDETFFFPHFLFTDLVADGPSGFILSGTYFPPSSDGTTDGLMLRFSTNGNVDSQFYFSGIRDDTNYLVSENCPNTALLRSDLGNGSVVGFLMANLCFDNSGRLKAFSPTGDFQGEFHLGASPDNPELQLISQIIETGQDKLVVLSGVAPTTGFFDYFANYVIASSLDSLNTAVIRQYVLPTTPAETSNPTPPAPIYAPTPVPYLKTLSLPKLNLKDGKLVCSAGTYNTGYALDGVIQGSSTSLFTPATYVYNLNVNGVAQPTFAVTSANPNTSWDMPSATSGSLITCSVMVTANGVTNIDRSSDNTAGVSAAKATQSALISKAESDYSALLTANEKAYQKALIDNRTKWRNDADTLRKNYQAEIAAIRALPSTKETRGSSLAALKNYTAAVKKNSADYKASKPAALAERDAANKTALDAKSAAVASANDAYGIFIESIGYGVLVP